MMGQFNKESKVSNVFGFSRNGDNCMATIRDLGTFEFAAVDYEHVVHRLRQAANAIEQSMVAGEKLAETADRQRLDAINRYNGTPAETKAAREDRKVRRAVQSEAKAVSAQERRAAKRAARKAR